MGHRQHPLGSGFPPSATAAEVLDGIDLSGRHAVVTGGHAGIGLEVTRALAEAGAQVLVGARDLERARMALADVPGVTVDRLDLIDPASIEGFAAQRLASGAPLHILVNNAGSSGGPERDSRGYERQFAVNHLGHFQLTRALLTALRAAGRARVVVVSSGAHRFGRIRWDDPHFTSGYDSLAAYAQSKTANVLFAVGLDARWSGDGIRGYAVHPGVVAGTKLNAAAGLDALRRMGLIDADGRPIIDPAGGKKTPAQGASTIVFAATSPLLNNLGGVYLTDNDVAPLTDGDVPLTAGRIPADAASHSIDPAQAERLWRLSEGML
ncbi:SDR family NAD(P)-dependent oxidoreductase [Sphingomonas sp. BK069]|uniref:SDR family NAD(P)-dependent oxidoreductase n=1 Tax=Sphingomonas sp. BK069 TaxID=2586979 RepID=UPI00160C5001|nr:SDR family NAD(P)-dependent oxidoreductase [Sphingomonas sp. BK069]MBB3349863.1 NAD(P)-dependent dehydrogenase (short-subunit alcohol dehydrogenase family) [Sphingomonas sp. BK069]